MRQIRLWTGEGGKDLFDIGMETYIGLRRVYAGIKLSRIVRKLRKGWKRDYRKRYYYLEDIKEVRDKYIEGVYDLGLVKEMAEFGDVKDYRELDRVTIEDALYQIFYKRVGNRKA